MDNNMNISPIIPPEADFTTAIQTRLERLQYWRKHIEKAIKRGHALSTFTDVVQSILHGKRLFFDNGKSFAIVEPFQHPLGVEVFVWVAGGEQEALYALEEEVMEFAKMVKARRLMLYGRYGFRKRIPSRGWKDTGQTMFVKDVVYNDLVYHLNNVEA
jgi:hypothetical protein